MGKPHAVRKKKAQRPAAAGPVSTSNVADPGDGVVMPGIHTPRKLKLASRGKAKKASKEEVAKRQNMGIAIGVIVCIIGCFLVLAPSPPNPDAQVQGGPPERPIPGAPSAHFHTASLDPTQRASTAPTAADAAAAEALLTFSADEQGSDGEEQAAPAEDRELTPAEKRAARKARKAARKNDNRAAGFGADDAAAGASADTATAKPTLGDDPRFKVAVHEVDLDQQAAFADMWSPREVCKNGAYDLECPAAHRLMHAELPDSIMFECSSSQECNNFPCMDGQCLCAGTAIGTDCGSVRMLHYEWNNDHIAKTPAEVRSGVPNLVSFTRLLRGTTPAEAIDTVLDSYTLVQDPQQGENDAKVAAKLKPELEFLLRATLETSPDGSVDLVPLLEKALRTSMQAQIWMSKNLVRYVPMPRALRLGVQMHGAEWFFDTVAEILRWAKHPGAAPIDFAKELDGHPGHNLLSLATHWQLYPAMQLILDNGGAAPGALRHAIANHDLVAVKILLEGGIDATAEEEKDAWGRSPLELARLAQDVSFEDVAGHIASAVGADAEVSSGSAGGGKKRRRKADGDSASAQESDEPASKYGGTGGVFFEQAGTDIQINCGVDVVDAADFSTDVFLRDYVSAGRPVFIKDAAADWGISTFRIETFPTELGEADVAANKIPYGDQLGIESHGMKLRDFMGYLKTVNSQSEEIPLVVSDTTFLDSNLMSNLDYVPGSAGTAGGDKFYHHTRYPWAGAGPLADALNSISTEDTPRWSHFFVGPASGGASFQTRCSLFTTVTDGAQLLLAFPPAQPAFGSAYSSEHPLEWMREVNANSPEVLQGGGPQLSSPLVCELKPGYTLYTPSMWTTANLNVEPTLSVTFEVINSCVL